jgi:hypothetical protein
MTLWSRWALSLAAATSIEMLAPAELQASVAPMPVTVEYSAVAGCPDVAYFKSIVVERLGADVFSDNAPVRVIILVTSQGQTFEGKIEWLDAKGNWEGDRTFPAHSTDCEDLVRAMAFTLALQLQLSATGGEHSGNSAPLAPSSTATVAPSSTPQSEKPSPPVTEGPKAPPSAIPAPPPTKSPAVLAFGAGAFLKFGTASHVVPFARVFGRVEWPRFALELATEAGMPTLVRRSDGAGFSRHELLASLAGCGNLRHLSACLIAKAGEIRVTGQDIDTPASGTRAIVETGFRIGAMHRLYGNTYVSAYGEGLVLPIRWSVTLDHDVVWTSPRFAETIGLDVSYRFE